MLNDMQNIRMLGKYGNLKKYLNILFKIRKY